MSSVAGFMNGFAERVLPRPRGRHQDFVFCPEDRFWFRPAYTEGTCPLCGEVAPTGMPPQSMWRQIDRSWLGMSVLAFESIAMLALVLVMWFR